MYAFELGVLLLATVAFMPVFGHLTHDACNQVPRADISKLNETDQIQVLEVFKNNLSCVTMKRTESDRMKRREVLQRTYCWGSTMMLKANHKSGLIRAYRWFLGKTSNLYMENNDNKYVDLELNCHANGATRVSNFLRYFGLAFLVLCLLAFGFHRIRTKDNRNRPHCRMAIRGSEIVCLDNEMTVVQIEDSNERKPKSCLPSKAEAGPKPKKGVTWTTNEIRVYDVHESEDFRDPLECMLKKMQSKNRMGDANNIFTRL